ncbi:hypothetical protein [Thalassotalea crassostreae]|nr:hypothetical protein [Thalassotalea crassostreae]
MEEQNQVNETNSALNSDSFDFDNSGWPRDFDIRIEVAEQREVLED